MSKVFKNLVAKLKVSTVIKLGVAIVILIVAASSFFVVDETELAVVTTFGRYSRTLGPGLQCKIPLGIEKSFCVPVKVVQTQQFGFKTIKSGRENEYRNNITNESTMLTGDLNIVDVEWIIQYRIEDPVKWLFGVMEKKQTIRDISRSVINTLVGDRAILDIMGQERASIEDKALTLMNTNFDQLGLGINVIAVKLQNIIPPQGVQDAFEDVNKAIQDMNRFINEGKEAYNSQIPKAQGEAARVVQQAQGYATERVNKALGDVARFNSVYDEYKRNPRVTRERLYMEMMTEVFGTETGDGAKSNATIIDGKLNNILPIKTLGK